MMISLFPLLVCIVGALVYGLSDGKVSELGRLAFVVGLLWLVYTLATKTVHVG